MNTADDSQIARIVALVDAMPERGVADDIVAALRARLGKLQPPRPVQFTRILFNPLDPLIVPAPTWRRGSLAIPRTALTPIANAIEALMPDEAAQVDAEWQTGLTTQARLTELAGAIWPQAAAKAEGMHVPPGWMEATGLPEGDFHPLMVRIIAVLAVGLEIQGLILSQDLPPEDGIRNVLGRTSPRGPTALSAVIAVLLARLAGSGRIIALGTEASGTNPSRAVDAAVDHTLDMLAAELDSETAIGAGAVQAAQDAGRIALLLQELEGSAATRPERKRRIDRLRRGSDALCRIRFEAAFQDELTAKITALPAHPDDSQVEHLESCARDLRRLETNGRRLGGGDHYDGLRRLCLELLKTPDSPLPLEDRVRLVEILVSPRDALTFLTEATTSA